MPSCATWNNVPRTSIMSLTRSNVPACLWAGVAVIACRLYPERLFIRDPKEDCIITLTTTRKGVRFISVKRSARSASREDYHTSLGDVLLPTPAVACPVVSWKRNCASASVANPVIVASAEVVSASCVNARRKNLKDAQVRNDNMDPNISQIARVIFSKPPGAAGTMDLGLMECCPPDASQAEQSQIIFEVLITMFLEGIKVAFGSDTRPEKLTPAQMERVGNYFNSIGNYDKGYAFYLRVKSEPLTQPPVIPRSSATELKHIKERFYDFERQLWHEVSFDYSRILPSPGAVGVTMVHKSI